MSKGLNYCFYCMASLTWPDAFCGVCGHQNASVDNLPLQLPCGSVLAGKFMIGRALGQGGFGITYIGVALHLDIKVAIKEYYPDGFVLRDTMNKTQVWPMTGEKGAFFIDGRSKFLQEAQTMARFASDPNIVCVRDYFQENGTAYIVMDYVEGKTLKQLAAEQNGRLPAAAVFSCLRPIMDSLAHVHAAGMLHRDISPDNIIVRPDGRAVLLDFGAARQISAAGEHSNTINVKHGYAPEEQYRTHGEQGPWTDIYALSATIYRLTTGQNLPQALDRAMAHIPLAPPNAFGAGMTPAQQAAVMRGLSVLGQDRQRSMAEFIRDLDAPARRTRPAPSAQPEPLEMPRAKSRFGRGWYIVSAASLLVLAIVFGFVFFADRQSRSLSAAETPAPTAAPTATPKPAATPTPSPVPTPGLEERFEKRLMFISDSVLNVYVLSDELDAYHVAQFSDDQIELERCHTSPLVFLGNLQGCQGVRLSFEADTVKGNPFSVQWRARVLLLNGVWSAGDFTETSFLITPKERRPK